MYGVGVWLNEYKLLNFIIYNWAHNRDLYLNAESSRGPLFPRVILQVCGNLAKSRGYNECKLSICVAMSIHFFHNPNTKKSDGVKSGECGSTVTTCAVNIPQQTPKYN